MIEVTNGKSIVVLSPTPRDANLLKAFMDAAVKNDREVSITTKGNLHQRTPWPLNGDVEYVVNTVRREFTPFGDDVSDDFRTVDLQQARFHLETQPARLLKLLRYAIEDGIDCPVMRCLWATQKEGLLVHRLDLGVGVVFSFTTPDASLTFLHLVFAH